MSFLQTRKRSRSRFAAAAAAALLLAPTGTWAGTISTVAGTGNIGFSGDGGPATQATLEPVGVAIDPAGNLFFVDYGNHRIRRVDAVTQVITTVAGNGNSAFDGDGVPATQASLSFPIGVTLDSSGNLYIGDFNNHRVRRVDAVTGVITTVAGNGTGGFSGDGGPAVQANLSGPQGVTVDSAGNLFFADHFNQRIRRVDAQTGVITTVAGDGVSDFGGDGGPATLARFSNPGWVALDSAGNLFVADFHNNRVRRIDAQTQVITTVVGNGTGGFSGDGGPATQASILFPVHPVIDSAGNLFFADFGNHRIRRVDAATQVITTVAGDGVFESSGDGGPAIEAGIRSPEGLAIDSAGNLFIADYDSKNIRRVAADPSCGNGILEGTETCDAGSANGAPRSCCTATCQVAIDAHVCRDAAGTCDLAEVCNGTSAACPADAFVGADTECRASAGGCDVAESCTGSAAACPIDAFVSVGTECRASAGDCDLAEACSGSAAACPTDALVAADTQCRASAGACDAAESCTGSAATCPIDAFVSVGTECRASAGDCDLAEACSGSATACPTDALVAADTQCRASAGACDAAESCTGSAAACPIDAFVSVGTECRASAGDCDLAEACSGSAAACPADALVAADTQCRASAGACDAAESCTGSAATCPIDAFVSVGTECRASAGDCDLAEACSGSATACPTDALVAADTQCRASAGACDAAESCTGSAATCPIDAFVSVGTECRASAGDCDLAEACSGSATACPTDALVAADTQCRASAGACDAAESCTGSAATCPIDAFVSVGTECRASAGDCDLAEACSGSAAACPTDALVAADTQCRASAGTCDAAESCTGSAAACPLDAFVGAGTECRASAGSCDLAEACSGSAAACPADAFVAADTQCRASAGTCDAAESCTGSAAACPLDAFVGAGTECRASAGSCDLAEACSGSAAACPADAFVAADTQCRASAGTCDAAESCTGSAAACPIDAFISAGTECRASAGDCDLAEACSGSAAACPTDGFASGGTPCGSAADSACTNPDTCSDGVCLPNNEPCAAFTDSGLCPFDPGPNGCDSPAEDAYTDQFDLSFTPVVAGYTAGYQLSGTDPSSAYYNAIVRETPGSIVAVSVRVPYPFVTLGADPLRVYDAAQLGIQAGTGCFQPQGSTLVTNSTPIRLGDYLALCDVSLGLCRNAVGACASNDDCIRPNASGVTCIAPTGTACDGTPGADSGGSCSFTVNVEVPASGEAYLNLHLGYGLQGARVDLCGDGSPERYDWATTATGLDALVSTAPAPPAGDVAIANCTDYTFQHQVGASPAAFQVTIENVNRFVSCATAGDGDCDAVPDALDLCPYVAGNDQAADADHDGRGDECECGDQNGDGQTTVSDLVAINEAIFVPSLASPLCDATNDGLCDVLDIVATNVEIFSPGNTSTCARQPVPGP